MEEYNHSSGCLSLEGFKCSSRALNFWKYLALCTGLIILFMLLSPFRCEAAEIDSTGITSGGETYGTLDSESDSVQSDEGDTLSSSSSETSEMDTQEEMSSVVSSGDSIDMLDSSESSVIVLSESDLDSDIFPLYDSYEEFMESPIYVTRYQNEILNKLEFIQYASAIMIALLFLLIFKKK